MQPNSQPTPPTAPDATYLAALQKSNKLKLIWGLICLVTPTGLFILSMIVYTLTNFLFSDASMIRTIINILLFIVGALTVLTWLPGIIVGIILLTTRKKI